MRLAEKVKEIIYGIKDDELEALFWIIIEELRTRKKMRNIFGGLK